MTRRTLLLGPLLVAMALSPPVMAQRPSRLPDETIEKIESAIRAEMARQSVPGMSAAVVAQRQLQWSAGFGKADLENDVTATAETVYRLASISKTIAAVAAMQLHERGKLDLDAPVQRYFPDFPEKPWPITCRQVLGHLSGIRHYTRDGRPQWQELESTTRYERLADGLGMFKDDPLLHQPGTRYSYSTHAYSLLGCVVEAAAGDNFLSYVRGNITQPAGASGLRDDDLRAIIPHRAQGYRKTATGQLQNSSLVDASYKVPGGGFCSSVESLAQFAIALQADRLMQRATRDTMWTRQQTNDGRPTAYGLGWNLGERKGRQVVSHGGAQQRVTTLLYMLPSEGFAVVLLCNLEGTSLNRLAERVSDVVVPVEP